MEIVTAPQAMGSTPAAHNVQPTRRKGNPIYPIQIDKKPTEHKQSCIICDAPLEKGDLRVKIQMETGWRRTRTYYFHIHCFLDKLIALLKTQGYDVSQYVAGRLFV